MSDIDVKQIKADINVIKEFAASKSEITDKGSGQVVA